MKEIEAELAQNADPEPWSRKFAKLFTPVKCLKPNIFGKIEIVIFANMFQIGKQ